MENLRLALLFVLIIFIGAIIYMSWAQIGLYAPTAGMKGGCPCQSKGK